MNYKKDRILRNKYFYNKRVREFLDLTQEPKYITDENKIKLNIDRYWAYSLPINEENEGKAKDECAGDAIEIMERLLKEKGYYNKRKVIIILVVGSLISLIIGFILLLPFIFGRGYPLAICKANRAIIRPEYSPIIINKYDQHVLYMNQGDLMLIKEPIKFNNSTLDPNYFSAILIKQVVLVSLKVDNVTNYPTYIMPPGIGAGIRFNNITNQYSIDLLTYERDGKPKRYLNSNVCENSFTRIDQTLTQYQKNYVFSRYGNHVISNSYITKLPIPKQGTLKWWTMSQTIFFQYFFQLFKSSDYSKEDESQGFDNFSKIDINSTTFAC